DDTVADGLGVRAGWILMVLLGLSWLTSVASQEPRTIPCLVARLRTINHTIDDEEVLIAINLWVAQSRHPDLPQPISDSIIIQIIDLWVRGADCRVVGANAYGNFNVTN
ncbi:hypothetical protein LM602_01930, partial [Candidatus Acetothermia bacterium]|nr:hypothetical protein [Candidatus Acetothermia bacterium]